MYYVWSNIEWYRKWEEEKKLCTLSREKGKPCERNNKNSKHIYVVCPMPFIEKKVSNKKNSFQVAKKNRLTVFILHILSKWSKWGKECME